MPKHKSEDFKMSAVEYYLTEDVSQEQVCRIFKCSPRSLMRWVEKYNDEGAVKRHKLQGCKYNLIVMSHLIIQSLIINIRAMRILGN